DRSISPGRLGAPTALAERGNDQRRRGRAWLLHRALLLADVLGLSLAFVASQFLFVPDAGTRGAVSPILQSLVFGLTLHLWVLIALRGGLYGRDHQRPDPSTVDAFVGVFAVVTIGAWLFSAIAWLTHAVQPNPPRMLTFWLLAIASVVACRAVA